MGFYSFIDKRAERALVDITNIFQNNIPIISKEKNEILFDGSQYGAIQLKAYHRKINKLMGLVYIYTWRLEWQGLPLSEHIKLQLNYASGFRKNPQFVSSSGHQELADILNNNKEIIDICHLIDFEKIEIYFNQENQNWLVDFAPNYGDYITVLIPPIFYARKPNQEEVKGTVQLINLIGKYIKSVQKGVII
ncbi:hypothetical protein ACQKL5_04080 [Peribacillus sp. NPDC097675]|uniref:hypothetical protein n=1 Tax=Peribacillus sp. NPDC097675 TaxID=3390618 RepID=UPI003CFD9485